MQSTNQKVEEIYFSTKLARSTMASAFKMKVKGIKGPVCWGVAKNVDGEWTLLDTRKADVELTEAEHLAVEGPRGVADLAAQALADSTDDVGSFAFVLLKGGTKTDRLAQLLKERGVNCKPHCSLNGLYVSFDMERKVPLAKGSLPIGALPYDVCIENTYRTTSSSEEIVTFGTREGYAFPQDNDAVTGWDGTNFEVRVPFWTKPDALKQPVFQIAFQSLGEDEPDSIDLDFPERESGKPMPQSDAYNLSPAASRDVYFSEIDETARISWATANEVLDVEWL